MSHDRHASARRGPVRVTMVAAAAAAALVMGCSDSSSESSTQTEGSGDLEQALQELVEMPGGPPGVVVVVQRGDDRQVYAAGVARVGDDAPPTVDDHLRIASVAKAFSGATALALVDEGTMTLDDTIGDRLPDLPAAWADVTLRQLLNHTSGVPDIIRAPAFGETVGASLDEPLPPEQLLSFVEDEPLVFPSGTRYEYSNSDNITVGLMIQSATGQPYAEVLAEQVLEPLGLDDTSLPVGVELPEPAMHGYDISDGAAPEDVTQTLAAGWAWASGGIVSTPADLNDFIRGYVGGELYEDASVRAAQQDVFIPVAHSEPTGPGENSASMALFRYQTPCGTMYGHTGNTFGYTNFAAATPDGERSVTTTISLQRTQNNTDWDLDVFDALRRAETAAVCFALSGS